jgi:hypothetical protein
MLDKAMPLEQILVERGNALETIWNGQRELQVERHPSSSSKKSLEISFNS